jgi:sugar phosphate isomerase/epimerase
MTLPYGDFPFARALEGIRSAGYEYVAWGVAHREADGERPVLAPEASPQEAKVLGQRCRDAGLAPLMMFSTVYPEDDRAPAIFENRIRQAEAAGIPQVLTFGHTEGGHRKLWVERFKRLAPIARDRGVTIVVKQHGGDTGTGAACASIVEEVDDPGVMVNYDAGNVLDYLGVDPLADILSCAPLVRSFCIKDHRDWPRDQDCGPGFGEIDHYRLLGAVARTGRPMPLCFENVFAPIAARPARAEEIDRLALRAREYVADVVAGLSATPFESLEQNADRAR